MKNSGVSFLWVARGGTPQIKEACGGEGVVVSWCDQLKGRLVGFGPIADGIPPRKGFFGVFHSLLVSYFGTKFQIPRLLWRPGRLG